MVAGYESPPFRELAKAELAQQDHRITSSGADIVWVGLGTPIGRGGDRPRPRPLRALHRREHVARVERHRRRDLQLGDPQGAPRRLSRRHRPGRAAHHRRDQAPHPARGREPGRRRRHHGDRRHGGRHRVAAVPRGDPPVPGRRRPAPVHVHPPHARALHRPRRRAQDQADAALRQRAAPHRHPARHGRLPLRGRRCRATSARRSRCSPRCRWRRSSPRATSTSSTRCRCSSSAEGVDDFVLDHFGMEAPPPDLEGWKRFIGKATRRSSGRRCGSRSSASTSSSRTPTCRSSRRCATRASSTAAASRSTGSTPRRSATRRSATGSRRPTAS